jgi:hypothetical protein
VVALNFSHSVIVAGQRASPKRHVRGRAVRRA